MPGFLFKLCLFTQHKVLIFSIFILNSLDFESNTSWAWSSSFVQQMSLSLHFLIFSFLSELFAFCTFVWTYNLMKSSSFGSTSYMHKARWTQDIRCVSSYVVISSTAFSSSAGERSHEWEELMSIPAPCAGSIHRDCRKVKYWYVTAGGSIWQGHFLLEPNSSLSIHSQCTDSFEG